VEEQMVHKLILRKQDLITNPATRLPVCLVLDRSPSMSGETRYGAKVQQTNPRPIDELNAGMQMFFDAVKNDELARYACEVAIVGFSGIVENLLDFDSIERAKPPEIELEMMVGGTHIGQAVKQGLVLLDNRKSEFKEAGVEYFQPWMVLMTDGCPTDDSHIEASAEISKRVKNKKLHIFPVAIGDGVDMDILAMFSPKIKPLKLKGLHFKEFFLWLSQSVSIVSQSIPGEKISLNLEGIKSWADLEV
jgi:uncharacterized protein YegL